MLSGEWQARRAGALRWWQCAQVAGSAGPLVFFERERLHDREDERAVKFGLGLAAKPGLALDQLVAVDEGTMQTLLMCEASSAVLISERVVESERVTERERRLLVAFTGDERRPAAGRPVLHESPLAGRDSHVSTRLATTATGDLGLPSLWRMSFSTRPSPHRQMSLWWPFANQLA